MVTDELRNRLMKIKKGEVPNGYNKCGIWIMPEDWSIIALEKLTDLIKDGTHNPPSEKIEGIPLLSVENIKDGKIDFASNTRKISNDDYLALHKYYEIQNGDILLTLVGSVGRTAMVENTERFSIQRSVGVIRANKHIDKLYLKHFIDSPIVTDQFSDYIHSIPARVGLKDLAKILIIVPKTDKEQQKIAEILSTWDKAIELKEQLIKEKKQQKKGLMRKLLTGEVRLSSFEGEWEEVTIDKIAKIYLGLTYTPTYVSEGVPFLSVKDINGGKISFSNTRYISQSEFENSTSNAKPKKGDIIFGRVGTLGNPIIVEDDVEFCIFVSLGFLRISSEDILNYFVAHWMDSELFKRQIESKIAGSSQKNLNTGWLKEFSISMPTVDEQRKISDVLTMSNKEIELLTDELEALKIHKKGLMQLLLTGIVRVQC